MNRNADGQRKRADTSDRPGRQMNKASGKGRTPAATDLGNKCLEMLHGQRKRADTTVHSSDRPGRQMKRNAAWPAEKGGHQ